MSGESGGGNLTLAVTLRAKREGTIGEIAGVYAQCPYISDAWATKPADLPSLHENDGYFIACDLMAVLAEVYDPGGANTTSHVPGRTGRRRPTSRGCRPTSSRSTSSTRCATRASPTTGALLDAGVSSVSRTVNGTCHAGDVHLPRPPCPTSTRPRSATSRASSSPSADAPSRHLGALRLAAAPGRATSRHRDDARPDDADGRQRRSCEEAGSGRGSTATWAAETSASRIVSVCAAGRQQLAERVDDAAVAAVGEPAARRRPG